MEAGDGVEIVMAPGDLASSEVENSCIDGASAFKQFDR